MRKTSLSVLVGVAALGGCGDPAIDLSLAPATPDADLSCVAAVRVYAWGKDINDAPPNTCLPLSRPVANFRELQTAIHGALELDLPTSGLAGIDIAGMTTPDCLGGDAVFYGGAAFTGGDMTVPLRAHFDCSTRQTLEVKPVEYSTLALTGQCGSTAPRLDRGSIHPTMLDQPLPSMVYDLSSPSAVVGGTGTAIFPDAMVSTDDDACVAVGDAVSGSIGCVLPGAPGVCTAPGQLELTTIDFDFAASSLDQGASLRYPQVVYGAVWDATANPKHAVANARVEVEAGAAGEVHYGAVVGTTMADLPGAQTTDAGGLFTAYMEHPITVTVSAPGYRTRSVRLAAADFVFGASTIVLSPL